MRMDFFVNKLYYIKNFSSLLKSVGTLITKDIQQDINVVVEKIMEEEDWYLSPLKRKYRKDKKIILQLINKSKKEEFLNIDFYTSLSAYVSEDKEVYMSYLSRLYTYKVECLDVLKRKIENIPKCFIQNKEIIIESIKISPFFYKAITKEDRKDLLKDKEFIKEAIVYQPSIIIDINNNLRSDEEFLKSLILINPKVFGFLVLKDKPSFYLLDIAIHCNVSYAKYLSDEKKDDRDYIYNIALKNGWIMASASTRLKNDKLLALIALKTNGLIIQEISSELRDDEDIVLAALKKPNTSMSIQVCNEFLNISNNIMNYISKRLINEIEDEDPIVYLETKKRKFDLDVKLKNHELTNTPRLKI